MRIRIDSPPSPRFQNSVNDPQKKSAAREPLRLQRDIARRTDVGDPTVPALDEMRHQSLEPGAGIYLDIGIVDAEERVAMGDERKIVFREVFRAPIAQPHAVEDDPVYPSTLHPALIGLALGGSAGWRGRNEEIQILESGFIAETGDEF